MARGGIPITTIATTLQCSRHTVYKALAQAHVAEKPVTAVEEVACPPPINPSSRWLGWGDVPPAGGTAGSPAHTQR